MVPSHTLRPLLIAGLIGELSFEAYAWLVSPLLFGLTLEPARLVTALVQMGTGITLPYTAAFAIHFCIGAVGFAFVFWAFHRLGRIGPVLAGAVAGVALWFVAQGMLAPLVGRSFMMGFGPYTQSSFIGHVGMTLIIGAVFTRLTSAARPHSAT